MQPISADEAAFLAAIRANPADDTTRLVYADWLDERNDPRAEYLRLVCGVRQVLARFAEVRKATPAEWANAVQPLCRIVMVKAHPSKMIGAIKVVREISGLGLAQAKKVAETRGAVIRSELSLDAAIALVTIFEDVAEVAIEPLN